MGRHPITKFLGVIGVVALATCVKLGIGHWVSRDANALYLLAVGLCAWLLGTMPGLWAVALATAAQAFFFIAPFFSLGVHADDVPGMITWAIEGAAVSVLVGALTKARESITAARDHLEETVKTRTKELQVANIELADSEAAQRLLFDANPVPLFVFDDETFAFTAVNDAALAQYRYTREEFLALSLLRLKLPEDEPALRSAVPAHDTWHGHAKHLRRDASIIDVEITSRRITIHGRSRRVACAVDRSEENRLGAQLLQSQKMDALGQLAGGIAHDFNNMLMVIMSYAHALNEELDAQHPLREAVTEIIHATERSADLTGRLLTFSRQRPLGTKRVDLNEVVRSSEKFVRRVLAAQIDVKTHFSPTPMMVDVDAGQIEQVIMNLAVNARDAMSSCGTLTIEIEQLVLDDSYAAAHPNVQPGPYAMLAVSDSGTGMDRETISKIFEPFFTTKEVGKGTGLGLSIVFGIVKQSGGHVEVYSEVGHGTTFKVYLPLTTIAAAPIENARVAEITGSGETVLIVEDESEILTVLTRTLARSGYAVLCAPGPEEAIEISRSHSGSIDLLVSDVIMPKMDGRSLAKQLKRERPNMKVLFMSGYTRNVAIDDKEGGFLLKPASPAIVRRKVRETLDAS